MKTINVPLPDKLVAEVENYVMSQRQGYLPLYQELKFMAH